MAGENWHMGDTLWSKTFRGIGNEDGDRSLIQTADGGFTFIANRSGKADLLHTSSSGDSLWEKEMFSGIGISIAHTSNQGYVVTGPNETGSVINIAYAGTGGFSFGQNIQTQRRKFIKLPELDGQWDTGKWFCRGRWNHQQLWLQQTLCHES